MTHIQAHSVPHRLFGSMLWRHSLVEAMASRYNAKVTLISASDPLYYAGLGEPSGPVMVDPDTIFSELKERSR